MIHARMPVQPWTRSLLPALLLAAAAVAVPARAQLQGQETEDSFDEAIEVSVVNLEVFVTDKKGQPVTGLAREDFEVLEDGKPVEITNFLAEAGAAPGTAASAAPATAARSEDQRLRLAVLVDDVNLGARNRNNVLASLPDFLRRQLSPGDQVMLVRYAGRLDIRVPLTGDVERVVADLPALQKLASDVLNREGTRDHAFEDLINALEVYGGWGPPAESRIHSYAEAESAWVRGSLRALDAVVGWMAGMPGRKAILYVSDGLSVIPGEDMYLLASLRSGFRGKGRISMIGATNLDLTKEFRDLSARAGRNRIAIYPIELEGMRMVRGTTLQENRAGNRQAGLRFLAEDTGGRALLNVAQAGAALGEMASDFASFYSIGYRPQRPADDREHRVEVRVRRRDAHVRHRRWYRDKTLGESIADRTLAAMTFGIQENPLEAVLTVGEPVPTGASFVVPVRVAVPISKLYLQPGEGRKEGRLRLFVVASGEGKVTPVRETRVVTVTVPDGSDTAPGGSGGTPREYVHEVRMTLEPGSYSVGVGLRDETATTTSYLQGKFETGGGGAAPSEPAKASAKPETP